MNTQIIIPSSGTIDIYNDVPMSLNYSISDIRDPDKRQAYWSKTITVPGTDNNNRMLMQIFEVGMDRQFNPNKKADCIIVADTAEVMKGVMQLLRIRITDKTKIEYELAIKGKLANIFTAMGDKKLSDIDLSTYDHTYNQTNIIDSWTAPFGEGYVYPFIDYGYSPLGVNYAVNHFFPAIYAKEYLDQIFAITGFQYESTFFNSNFFKRLIIPFNSDKLKVSDATIATRKVRVSRNPPEQVQGNFTSIVQNVNIKFDDNTTPPNIDLLNQYDPITNFRATIENTGMYDISATIYPRYVITVPSGKYCDIYLRLILKTPTAAEVILDSNAVRFYPDVSWGTGEFIGVKANGDPDPSPKVSASNVLVPLGSYIFVRMVWRTDAGITGEVHPIILEDSFLEIKCNSALGIQEGDIMSINDALPQEIKMRDFFTSLIKMFNLYLETDENIPNKLLIEPRNEYYNVSGIIDWTLKLDHSRPFEINPMAMLDAKEYLFTYSDDDDYFNKLYKDRYGLAYGNRLINIDNDFLQERKEIKPIFAPTPLAGDVHSNRIIPEIWAVGTSAPFVPKSSKLRILYYGGLLTSDPVWNFTSVSASPDQQNEFAYAGHLDNPYNPTIDLNFGVPGEVYYPVSGTITYTNNNLYNKYWKQHIEEITDKNSSLVTGWFLLKPTDILQLDFRNKIFIDGVIYRLNKIYDYNPLLNSVTKCELIKAKDIPPFKAKHSKVYTGANNLKIGGTDEGEDNSEFMPATGSSIGTGMPNANNQPTVHPRSGNIIIGERNYVDGTAERIMIVGVDNSVGAFCKNVTLFNSSGCVVVGGLSEVHLVNSKGVTVTESNKSYSGDNKINEPDSSILSITVSLTADQIQTANSVPIDTGIPLPSVTQAIEFVSGSCELTFVTTVFDVGTRIELITDTADERIAIFTVLQAAATRFQNFAKVGALATQSQIVKNKRLMIRANADSATGDGTATIYILYRIINI